MSKTRSQKSNYPSRYAKDGWVTPAQYIVELLCENKAKKYGTGELPLQFWNLEEWANEFKSQLRATHKLLKTYDVKAIVAAIKEKRLFTLRPKFIEPMIQAKQKILPTIPNDIKLKEFVENPTVRQSEDKVMNKFGDLDD